VGGVPVMAGVNGRGGGDGHAAAGGPSGSARGARTTD
jgi:hypothetical protein